ncbi:hypothetical protein MMC27_000342 [Xylographa pallens]|nr:hypothetical protein [Xylographa pallens]
MAQPVSTTTHTSGIHEIAADLERIEAKLETYEKNRARNEKEAASPEENAAKCHKETGQRITNLIAKLEDFRQEIHNQYGENLNAQNLPLKSSKDVVMEILSGEDNSEQKSSQDDVAKVTTEVDIVFAEVKRDCLEVGRPTLDIDEASARAMDQAGETSLVNGIMAWLARLFPSSNRMAKSSVKRKDLREPDVREERAFQIPSGATSQAAAVINNDNFITTKTGGTWSCAWLTNRFVESIISMANSEHSEVNGEWNGGTYSGYRYTESTTTLTPPIRDSDYNLSNGFGIRVSLRKSSHVIAE